MDLSFLYIKIISAAPAISVRSLKNLLVCVYSFTLNSRHESALLIPGAAYKKYMAQVLHIRTGIIKAIDFNIMLYRFSFLFDFCFIFLFNFFFNVKHRLFDYNMNLK